MKVTAAILWHTVLQQCGAELQKCRTDLTYANHHHVSLPGNHQAVHHRKPPGDKATNYSNKEAATKVWHLESSSAVLILQPNDTIKTVSHKNPAMCCMGLASTPLN
jgi:hypothetical protein